MTSGKPSPVVVLVAALALCVAAFVILTIVTVAGHVMGWPAVAISLVILSVLCLGTPAVMRRRR